MVTEQQYNELVIRDPRDLTEYQLSLINKYRTQNDLRRVKVERNRRTGEWNLVERQGINVVGNAPSYNANTQLPQGARLPEGSAPLAEGDKIIGVDAQGVAIISRQPLPSDRPDVQQFVKEAQRQGYSNADIANVATVGGTLVPSQSKITQQQVAQDKAEGFNNAEILARSSGLTYQQAQASQKQKEFDNSQTDYNKVMRENKITPPTDAEWQERINPVNNKFAQKLRNVRDATTLKLSKARTQAEERRAQVQQDTNTANRLYTNPVEGFKGAVADVQGVAERFIYGAQRDTAAAAELILNLDKVIPVIVKNPAKSAKEAGTELKKQFVTDPAAFAGGIAGQALIGGELAKVRPSAKLAQSASTPSPEGSLLKKTTIGQTEVIEKDLFTTKTSKPKGAYSEADGLIKQTSELKEGETGALITTRTPVTVKSLGVDFKLSVLETRPVVTTTQNVFDVAGTVDAANLVGTTKQITQSKTYRPIKRTTTPTAQISTEGATIIDDSINKNQLRNAEIEAVSTSIITQQKAALAKKATDTAYMVNIIEETARAKTIKDAFAIPKPKKPIAQTFPKTSKQKPQQIQVTASRGDFKQTGQNTALIEAEERTRILTKDATRQTEPRTTITEIKTSEIDGEEVLNRFSQATALDKKKVATQRATVKEPPKTRTTIKTVSVPKRGYTGDARITTTKIEEGGASEQVITLKTKDNANAPENKINIAKTKNIYQVESVAESSNTIKALGTDVPEPVIKVKAEFGKGEIQPYVENAQTRKYAERVARRDKAKTDAYIKYNDARDATQTATRRQLTQEAKTTKKELTKPTQEKPTSKTEKTNEPTATQQTVFAEVETPTPTGKQTYDALQRQQLLKQNIPYTQPVAPTIATVKQATHKLTDRITNGFKRYFRGTQRPIIINASVSPKVAQELSTSGATLLIIKPASAQQPQIKPATITDTQNAQIQKPNTQTILKPAQAQQQIQKQIQEQTQQQVQINRPPSTITTQRAPRITTRINRIEEPPTIVKISDKDDTKKKKKGFNVFTRRAGKFVKINTSPLTETEAINYGAYTVRNTSDATFKIKETNAEATSGKFNLVESLKNLYRKGDLYIQPREQRIKTKGEKEQITLKGIRTNLSKGYVARFARRTIRT